MAGPRRFDHDEARRRYAAGESITLLAREYGVTYNGVWLAVKDDKRRESVERNRRWREAVCEDCGGRACRIVAGKKRDNHDGRILCATCRGKTRRERLLFDASGRLVAVRCQTIACANGERWQPPEHFARGDRLHDVREGGIHSQCRACSTRARREYRHAHRERERAYDRAYKARTRKAAA